MKEGIGMEKENAVEVRDISKIYRLYNQPVDRLKESLFPWGKSYHVDHFALDKISFSVQRGKCYGIVGTNGSGKSTLLKIITGVLTPSSGEVEVDGKISALLELGAGFNMEYTGIENIYLSGTMSGYSNEEIDQKLDNIINFAEIGDFINQPVKTYSSGMFARLAFAVAINVDPDILIVDEALSVGDIFFQAKCYRKFDEFKEQGKTIIFVSHDLSSVLKYCDEALLINRGEMISKGDTKKVIDSFKKVLAKKEPFTNQDENSFAYKTDFQTKETFWKDGMINNPHYIEYGDQQATIVDYGIFNDNGDISPLIQKGDLFEIRIKVKFHKDLDNPILAFTIKNLKGVEISGTNTMLEGKLLGKIKKNEIVEARFLQKATLQGGQYLLSLGCTGFNMEELVVFHRLYDACNLEILSADNTIGFFDLYSKCEILK